MNDCANVEVRDRLPDLVNDSLPADMRGVIEMHLRSCADCAAEAELLAVARGVLRTAPPVDAAAIARAIAPRVPRRPRSVWGSMTVRRAAAVVAIVAGGGASWVVATRSSGSEGAVGVGTTAAEKVAASAPAGSEPAATAVEPELTLAAGVGELSDADLDVILREIESLDAMPSEEPQPLFPTLGEMEGGV